MFAGNVNVVIPPVWIWGWLNLERRLTILTREPVYRIICTKRLWVQQIKYTIRTVVQTGVRIIGELEHAGRLCKTVVMKLLAVGNLCKRCSMDHVGRLYIVQKA